MIYKEFKEQPVTAFYKILAGSFLYIMAVSLFISALVFVLGKLGLEQILDAAGLKKLKELMEMQGSNTDLKSKSEAMNGFIKQYPSFSIFIPCTIFLLVVTMAYLFNVSQLFIKKQLMRETTSWWKMLTPGRDYIKISIYLFLITGIVFSAMAFTVITAMNYPLMGLIAGFIFTIMIVRNILFIPGVVLGNMSFIDSLRYSLETISSGRAFKIQIFGFLIFLILGFIISGLLYFPSEINKALWFQIFLNLFAFYIQIGCVSVGIASLFIRYGNFQEEKMAD